MNEERKNGVTVSDDFIWEDRQTKKKLKDVMQKAYEEGQKPRFNHGKLYIDGVLSKNDSLSVNNLFSLFSCYLTYIFFSSCY